MVIGQSGAGKSTLLRCLNRLIEPTAGEIGLNGSRVTGATPEALRAVRRQMGMIFQQFNLVKRASVMENVLAGRLGHVPGVPSLFGRFPRKDRELALTLSAAGWDGGFRRAACRSAVRRRAAARGHRAGAGTRAQGDPGGRADGQFGSHAHREHHGHPATHQPRARTDPGGQPAHAGDGAAPMGRASWGCGRAAWSSTGHRAPSRRTWSRRSTKGADRDTERAASLSRHRFCSCSTAGFSPRPR